MKLELKRTYGPSGTNGKLFCNGEFIAYTIELPWKDNKTGISCIPEGNYRVSKRYSIKWGHHLWVEGVKNRQCILFHPANNALLELKGCIAPVTVLTGQGQGSQSQKAMQRLKEKVFPYLEKGFRVTVSIYESSVKMEDSTAVDNSKNEVV